MHDQSDDCNGKKGLKSTKRNLFMNHMRSIQVHFHNVNCQNPPTLFPDGFTWLWISYKLSVSGKPYRSNLEILGYIKL